MWQEHAEQHRAAGGSEQDEAAIALALAQRDRRRRSRRPPPKRTGAEPPFQGLELETEQPSRDPYAGLEEFDLSTLRPYPALPISPLAPPPAAAPPALPSGTSNVERPSGSGQAPHPLAALFPDDGDDSPPDASATGTSAAAYEVVEAELLDDLDPDGDGGDEDEGNVWEM
ncbi:hypothetical protein ACFWNG_06395 [Streptomyces sp. NPDC058391]|uniref:hypothetical protein n=1 Tax=Streptomyces sp. NPDC058391 TaxID=3346476 RepID=UPI003652A191